jgi:hypothetical protein
LSTEESDNETKPPKIASPVSKKEEDEKPPVAKSARTSDEDKDEDRPRGREDKWERDREDRYYGPPQQYPPQPMFTKENVPRLMALGLFIGIILLFIGSMLTAGAIMMEPDAKDPGETKRTLLGAGVLIDGIGLFIMSIFIVLPLLIVRDLDEKQRTLIIILTAAIIIGFALLTASIAI